MKRSKGPEIIGKFGEFIMSKKGHGSVAGQKNRIKKNYEAVVLYFEFQSILEFCTVDSAI